jgi:hypothetical protein
VWPAALAVGVLLLAGAFAGGWFSGRSGLVEPVVDAAKGETFTYGTGGEVPEFAVSPGSCGSSPLQQGRGVQSSVTCDELHDFEVVYGTELYQADDMAYPGDARLTALGESVCAVVFNDDAYVLSDKRGGLTYMTLVPTEQTWTDGEQPEQSVLCAIRDRDRAQMQASVSPQE